MEKKSWLWKVDKKKKNLVVKLRVWKLGQARLDQ